MLAQHIFRPFVMPVALCTAIFGLLPYFSAAQTTDTPAQPNFYDIQRAAEEYWKDKLKSLEEREDGEIEGGYNQYKRWEWFWEDRLYPSGELRQPDILYKESRKLAALNSRRKSENTLGVTAKPNWQEIGPNVVPTSNTGGAGRVNNVHVIPDFPNLIWAATAGGGAWKSTDGGTSWRCTTDQLPTLGVNDIATAPGNPNIVYLATGDGDGPGGYDQPIAYSIGVLKSTDAGETWQQTGLQYSISNARRIHRLLQHPENAAILVAATDNGIFKTTDAGATWTQKATGNFRDMEFKPEDPSVMYAAAGSQVYRSTDEGDTWRTLTTSIPNSIGRIALAVTYANPEYVYALTTRGGAWDFGGFYRSTDGGTSWTRMATTPNIIGRDLDGMDTDDQQGWYDLCVAASHNKSNTVYVGGINIWKSTNGGASWSIASHWYGQNGTPYCHADIHGLTAAFDVDEIYVGSDGGVARSVNQKTWKSLSDGMAIMQFYRMSSSQADPRVMIGGAQDNGTSLLSGGKWTEASGGDGMNCLIDYKNPINMYASSQKGAIKRSVDGGKNFAGTISDAITGESGGWVTPYIFHPTDPKILFAGYRNVWKTTNGGGLWTRLGQLPNAGGTLSYLAIAPSDPNVIFAGNSGRLYKTTDGGGEWKAVTLPGGGAAKHIAFHPENPDKCWIVNSGFGSQKVFESNDGGAKWTDISAGMPSVPVNCIVYQPNSPDRLYVGSDLGVFIRDTISKTWISYNEGLPNVIVNWLEIYLPTNKLRAATFGRGMWEANLSDCGAVPVSVTVTGQTTFCEGDSVVLQASGSYKSYQWSSGETTPRIVVRQSGVYRVVVTNDVDCQGGSEAVEVNVGSVRAPTITSTRPFGLCPDDSITLDAGLGFAKYQWSNGDTTRRTTIKQAGIYTVTVSSATGCSASSAPLEIKNFPPTVKATLFKHRDTLGTIGARSYQWYKNDQPINGATKQIIILTAEDLGAIFKVKITDDNGCTTFSDPMPISVVSVAEQQTGQQWEVSPNPFSSTVTLSGAVSQGGELSVKLTDVTGKSIALTTLPVNAGAVAQTLNFGELSTGTYLLHISAPGKSTVVLKMIKE